MPFLISVVSTLHILVLHEFSSSNGLDSSILKQPIKLGYYKLKDLLGLIIVSTSLSELALYSFNLGHTANYILARPLVTPEHIVPE